MKLFSVDSRMLEIKKYRNKSLGEFYSIPVSMIDADDTLLDSLYLALHFNKLHTKSLTTIRESKHYAATLNTWRPRLSGVELSDIGKVAEALKLTRRTT